MKDVILNEIVKKKARNNFAIERIIENEKLFTEKEIPIIINNDILVKKIYMLGIWDKASSCE